MKKESEIQNVCGSGPESTIVALRDAIARWTEEAALLSTWAGQCEDRGDESGR